MKLIFSCEKIPMLLESCLKNHLSELFHKIIIQTNMVLLLYFVGCNFMMLLFHEIMVLWYDFMKLWFYGAIS